YIFDFLAGIREGVKHLRRACECIAGSRVEVAGLQLGDNLVGVRDYLDNDLLQQRGRRQIIVRVRNQHYLGAGGPVVHLEGAAGDRGASIRAFGNLVGGYLAQDVIRQNTTNQVVQRVNDRAMVVHELLQERKVILVVGAIVEVLDLVVGHEVVDNSV